MATVPPVQSLTTTPISLVRPTMLSRQRGGLAASLRAMRTRLGGRGMKENSKNEIRMMNGREKRCQAWARDFWMQDQTAAGVMAAMQGLGERHWCQWPLQGQRPPWM